MQKYKSWEEIDNPKYPEVRQSAHEVYVRDCYELNGLHYPSMAEVYGRENDTNPISRNMVSVGEFMEYFEKYFDPIEHRERSRVKLDDDGWVIIKRHQLLNNTYDFEIKSRCKTITGALLAVKHLMEKNWMNPFMIDAFIDCLIKWDEKQRAKKARKNASKNSF